MERKVVLVTGGAGFLGSHLCERHLELGNEVICLDNLLTGSKENLRDFWNHPCFTFVEADVCDPLPLFEVDEIYNLACPASPIHYQADPIKSLKTSILGALNVLDLTLKTGAKVLQASTSEVYGDPEIHPQPEKYWGYVNPIGLRACYDEGKRCAETFFFDYHRQFGVKIKVARIFNTYGPRMHPNDGRVVSNFIVQALKGDPLTIYGNGSQTRSFCYVDDLIRGLILLMESPDPFIGPVNLGNPCEFKIADFAQLVLDHVASSSTSMFFPLPSDDPRQRKPDIQLAKEALGWEPEISLQEGLLKTIDYFSTLLQTVSV